MRMTFNVFAKRKGRDIASVKKDMFRRLGVMLQEQMMDEVEVEGEDLRLSVRVVPATDAKAGGIQSCSTCRHLTPGGYCVPHQRKIHGNPITASQKAWITHGCCNDKYERIKE